ncbi:hypothetical protein TorRG33x02_326530, partial [Trema orientale]
TQMGIEADLACPKLLCVKQMGSNNLFSFSFGKPEDHQRILEGSPWSFENQLISLVKLKGVCDFTNINFNMVAFWVQILNAPTACMTDNCVAFGDLRSVR